MDNQFSGKVWASGERNPGTQSIFPRSSLSVAPFPHFCCLWGYCHRPWLWYICGTFFALFLLPQTFFTTDGCSNFLFGDQITSNLFHHQLKLVKCGRSGNNTIFRDWRTQQKSQLKWFSLFFLFLFLPQAYLQFQMKSIVKMNTALSAEVLEIIFRQVNCE